MPREGSRKGLLIGLAGGGGVVALAVVIVLFLVLGGSDADYEESWTVPKDQAAETLLDSYVSGDTLVRASALGVTGQALDDGEQMWFVKPPSGQRLCAVSPSAPGDIAVYAYGPRGHCAEAAAVDITSGKRLWKAPLEKGSEYQKPSAAAAAVVQGVAVVSNGRVTAYDLKSGKQRWTIGPENNELCRSGDTMASEDALLAYVDCVGREKSGLDDRLVSLDPADGSAVWKAKVKNAKGEVPPSLINVSPPVLRLEDEAGKVEFASLDDEGENPLVFPAFDPGHAAGSPKPNGGHTRYRLLMYANTLVGVSKGTEVMGVDVTTGRPRWQKSLGDEITGAVVLGDASEEKATIYALDATHEQERLMTVDPDNGEISRGDVVREVSDDDTGEAGEKRVGNGFYLKSGETLVEFAARGEDEFAVRAYTPD